VKPIAKTFQKKKQDHDEAKPGKDPFIGRGARENGNIYLGERIGAAAAGSIVNIIGKRKNGKEIHPRVGGLTDFQHKSHDY